MALWTGHGEVVTAACLTQELPGNQVLGIG